MVIFHSYVSLPEGNPSKLGTWDMDGYGAYNHGEIHAPSPKVGCISPYWMTFTIVQELWYNSGMSSLEPYHLRRKIEPYTLL